MRKVMSKPKDKMVYKQTANTTKSINLGIYTFRGGIRF